MSTSARIIRPNTPEAPFAPLEFPIHNEPGSAVRIHRNQANLEAPPEPVRSFAKKSGERTQSAQELLAIAHAQAEAIINDANAQAQRIEAQAYEQGYSAGQLAGKAAMEERLAEIKAEYQESISRLHRLRGEMIAQAEQQIIQLVMEVAKKVVQREVSLDREIVLALIKVALSRVNDNTPVTVRVHHDDYQFLEHRRQEFLSGENGVVTLVEDRSISRGGCLIETNYGQIDARIEQQFKEIERGFLS